MSKKLQNIKAIKQLINGDHRTQTRTKHPVGNDMVDNPTLTRNVGDKWIEEKLDGTKSYITQRDGYQHKSLSSWDAIEFRQSLIRETKMFKQCPKDICTCVSPSIVDIKMNTIHELCLECVTQMETSMQIRGEFDEYARDKIFQNVKSYIRDMDIEMERWKSDINGQISFANGDSTVEEWSVDNKQLLISKVESEYLEMRENILNSYDPERRVNIE